MICYLIFSVLIAAAAFTVRRRSLLRLTGAAFYAVQAAFAVRIVAGGLYGETSAVWFAFDAAGTLFYCLLCIVSAFAFFHSKASLHDCDLRQTRTYAGLLMLLTTAIAGAYFASNLAVTWIFLEATTLCSAGIVYHRRTAQALEAAWKYVFVCSTGIAMAYLGILLLAAATDCESLDYATVAAAAPGGSALYLKTAFLLILCGYSCKAELFPLYTVGVDANFAAPAPASALISTGLVNAGFLALLLFTLGLAVLDAIIKQRALLESFAPGNFLANLVSGCILYVSLGGVGWLIGWLLHYAKESTHENKS